MNAKEFIETFQKSGYGRKKSAETYAENYQKNDYTTMALMVKQPL